MDEVELIWRNAVLGQAPNSLLMPPGLLECLHYLAFQLPRSTACIRMPTGSLVRTTRARHERPRAIASRIEIYRALARVLRGPPLLAPDLGQDGWVMLGLLWSSMVCCDPESVAIRGCLRKPNYS